MNLDIGFKPETPAEALEYRKQEIANATDYVRGFAEAIQGKTWQQIWKIATDAGL